MTPPFVCLVSGSGSALFAGGFASLSLTQAFVVEASSLAIRRGRVDQPPGCRDQRDPAQHDPDWPAECGRIDLQHADDSEEQSKTADPADDGAGFHHELMRVLSAEWWERWTSAEYRRNHNTEGEYPQANNCQPVVRYVGAGTFK